MIVETPKHINRDDMNNYQHSASCKIQFYFIQLTLKKNMLQSAICLALLLISLHLQVDAHTDYYWRDYDGKVPDDAIIGGKDDEGQSVYIGQVYISREGLVPVKIKPLTAGVYAEIKGVQFADKNIKILCGQPENFEWMQTNSSSLHVDLIKKHPVIGGHEDGWGTYFVGRITIKNETCIRKILENGMNGRNYFYGVNEFKRSQVSNLYEILINKASKDKY